MNLPFNVPQAIDYNSKKQAGYAAISLFSGAGGMDIGFKAAGFDIKWANDFDKTAVETYKLNLGNHIVHGDIDEYIEQLHCFKGVDCLFGGPPCQGFSVAGKMALDDPRSKLVKSFMNAVAVVKPRAFVMENVKALGTLSKFKQIRDELRETAYNLGYNTELVILNSKDFGVPQARERIFFVGFLHSHEINLYDRAVKYSKPMVSTSQAIEKLGIQGTETNPKTCNAVVTLAENPVLRKSAYAGMIFNGLGRPLNPDLPCSTLPASMGGNKTPIIDERHYYGDGTSWVEEYHAHLISGGAPYKKESAPEYLRRLTLQEARILHTFPESYKFAGGNSAVYRQIGNAVPCKLAEAVARMTLDVLNMTAIGTNSAPQLTMSF